MLVHVPCVREIAVPSACQDLVSKARPHVLTGPRRALLEDCMRVLFYRDCRALNRIQIAKATVEGTVVSDAYTVRALLHNPRLVQFV